MMKGPDTNPSGAGYAAQIMQRPGMVLAREGGEVVDCFQYVFSF